jgi:secreted trypsin-like serine protease
LALKSDGTVVAWGDNECGQTNVPSGLTNVVAIAGGGDHSLALKADGAVVAWGAGTTNSGSEPNVGQSIVPAGLTNVVAIGGGNDCSLALVNLPPMNAPPVITTQPTGCTNVVGTTATFLSNPHFSEAGQFTFSVGGDPNAVFDILVSTNLAVADWSLLSTFTNITGNDTITLPVVNDSAAFYRLRSH